jgi:hypothetical protein
VPPVLGLLSRIVLSCRRRRLLWRHSRTLAQAGIAPPKGLVVRPDVLDRIDGYRIYGAVADVLFGVGWIVLGVSFMGRNRGAEPAAATAPGS